LLASKAYRNWERASSHMPLSMRGSGQPVAGSNIMLCLSSFSRHQHDFVDFDSNAIVEYLEQRQQNRARMNLAQAHERLL
jgi:hypothetical protein